MPELLIYAGAALATGAAGWAALRAASTQKRRRRRRANRGERIDLFGSQPE